MRFKQFIKDFWKENKKDYMWACIALTFITIVIYDIMFLSMTHQAHVTPIAYVLGLPFMFGLAGILAFGIGLFMYGGDYK